MKNILKIKNTKQAYIKLLKLDTENPKIYSYNLDLTLKKLTKLLLVIINNADFLKKNNELLDQIKIFDIETSQKISIIQKIKKLWGKDGIITKSLMILKGLAPIDYDVYDLHLKKK